jgi:DnaK suppressor protein
MTQQLESTGQQLPLNLRRIQSNSGLSPDQVESLRQLLVARRQTLLREHEEHLEVRFPPSEQVSEAEEDAARTNQQEMLLGLAESERALLQMVERALRKIEDGTYGLSEESGDPIPFERLRAVPWARFTASEQEVLEREVRARVR